MSSEDGFLEELNLIKNSRFTEQDRQPENWMQFGGCTLKCIETTVPFSDNRFACLVHNRSARFAGVAQNILGKLVDGARYKLTAQVRLADTVEDVSTQDKISCTLHYKLQGEARFQQLKLTEVGLVKVTQWSYLIGWLDLTPIQKNGVPFAAIRLCFDGPEGKNDFLVSNVLLTQEYAEDEARKFNIVSNGAFDQFVLTPQNWKGVGQASVVLSDELFHGNKQSCMTAERPFAYSGIAQSILDIVEPGRHYSFTTYVRIVEPDDEKAKDQHTVKWMLKYNTGESKGDIAYEIAKSDKVDSTKWTKMNGELNMTELKTSTGRPVLAALSHKSNADGNKAKDQFGQPLEYCTFHLETTAGVNLCIAGPRMIDGGKILKPSDQPSVKPAVAAVPADDDDDQPKDSASEASSARSSSSSSEDEDEEEKKDSEKESPTEEKEKAALIEKEPDTLPVKQREQDQQLKKLHHAIEIGDRDEVVRIVKNDQYLVNKPESTMEFTAAHQAAIHKRAELIRPLYDYAADFNSMSRAGFMPIHYASWNNDVECLEQLRLFGASLNELTAERHTPLHIAAMRGNKEAVKWLMINGCVLNYRDNYDRTPADVASLNDHDAISILIAKCVNKLKQNQDIDGIITETDLSAAVTPMSSLTANGPEILDSLPEQVQTNAADVDQLHQAIAKNDESTVKEILVQKPHIVNLPSRRGETAIHVATINGYPNIIKMLSSMGSELSQQTPTGYQPIHLATLHKHIPCLDMLNSLDVDIDAKTPDQQTPLHLAAERGLLASVKWLIEQGAVLNFRNSQRKNPSDLALEKGHPDIAELIKACVAKLKRGEDVADILRNY
ncbi:uncharacterized protein LOC142343163 isoform X2 [Convolutriloba macropyga]|uniref:uncharacterized protein LOC142343163 isoform X2 n=1 Tax=Convolutriloba macropyga TaxID=536237 RepID=UPI003F5288AB